MPSPHPPAAPPPRRRDPAEGSLPAVRGTRANNSAGDASCELLPDGRHANFHKCRCYGHEKALPNYRLLAIPKTNNYYAATGGCPCIPRAPAHPGSWRLRKAQMRSATHRCGHGCINRQAATNPSKNTCCVHTGYQYGWKEGPHTVLGKNTAASGKCDTFGNLAFKSTSKKYLPPEDDVSDLSSVDAGKLEDLEGLILSEHQERMRVENDVMELEQVQSDGTADLYKRDRGVDDRRRHLENATEEQLNELLREVSGIVDRPLNQTNMEVLRRIIHRQEMLQRKREYFAAKESNAAKE